MAPMLQHQISKISFRPFNADDLAKGIMEDLLEIQAVALSAGQLVLLSRAVSRIARM